MFKRILAAATLTLIASGCSMSVGGRLGELKQLARSCPRDEQIAALVALDVRRELRGAALMAARMGAIAETMTRTAVCGGRLRVVVFSSSAVASVVVVDDELRPHGATENARLRRVDGIVKKTMESIEAVMPGAVARVSSRGGDPLGQLELAQEYATGLGDGFEVHVLIETSGFTRSADARHLDLETAVALATRTRLPDLARVAVLTFAGLGRVGAGAPPPTRVVAALRAFYERICERTRAGSCRATSEIEPIGV